MSGRSRLQHRWLLDRRREAITLLCGMKDAKGKGKQRHDQVLRASRMRREKVRRREKSDLDHGVYHTCLLLLHPVAQYINSSADTHVC